MSPATVVLGIELTLRTPEAGGRTRPLDPSWYQYRPNWGFAGLDHPRGGQAGAPVLCWRNSPVTSGDTTFAAIQPMYPEYWGEVTVGDVLYLYEGVRLCGLALVCVREDLPEWPHPLNLTEAVRWSAWVHLGDTPNTWCGVDDIVTVDGVLSLPGSAAKAVLVPALLSYDEQQDLSVSLPWAADLVVDDESDPGSIGFEVAADRAQVQGPPPAAAAPVEPTSPFPAAPAAAFGRPSRSHRRDDHRLATVVVLGFDALDHRGPIDPEHASPYARSEHPVLLRRRRPSDSRKRRKRAGCRRVPSAHEHLKRPTEAGGETEIDRAR